MKNENKSTERSRHNIALAVLLILLIWACTLICVSVLSWILRGDSFILRYILILPFSFVAVFTTRMIWSRYSK